MLDVPDGKVMSLLDNPPLRASAILCALAWGGLVWCGSAHAEEPAAVVVVEQDESSCSKELTSQFVRELRLRTAAQVLSAPSGDGERARWRLTLSAVDDDQGCEVGLSRADQNDTFLVAAGADQLEIASVATRLAWIIDGTRRPEATQPPQPAANEQAGSETAVSAATQTDITSEAGADRGAASVVAVDASGGAMWLPSAQAALMMTRVGLSWKPWSALELRLVGRLPIDGAEAESAGVQISYKPWSVDLTAAYAPSYSGEWSWSASGGARWTFGQLTAREVTRGVAGSILEDTPARMSGEPESAAGDALLPWSVVAQAGASRALTSMLAVRVDATAAASLVDRKIRDDQRVLMDLGRLDLDLLAGLELRF
jgi:hypothetical protein